MNILTKIAKSMDKSWVGGRLRTAQAVIDGIGHSKMKDEVGKISDGYHTFNELYEYRLMYNAALFNEFAKQGLYNVHKSVRHYEGDECFGGGWFIVMAMLPTGQISNHYKMEYWDLFNIATQEKADKWDGHSPAVASFRLLEFIKSQGV